MPSWLLIVIVSIVELVLFSALSGAILIVASNRNAKLKKELIKKNKLIRHQEQLLNAYGIKEIKIGGNENDL